MSSTDITKNKEDTNVNLALEPVIEVLTANPKHKLRLFEYITSRPWLLLYTLTLGTLIIRLITMPNYLEADDSIFFTRGIIHYSTLDLSPHWPDYPVYMWLGGLFHLVIIADPGQAFLLQPHSCLLHKRLTTTQQLLATLLFLPVVGLARP